MISIKDYAKSCGKSEQAVYKQLKSARNKERLAGHVEVINGKKWLDEVAVKILDESRSNSPVVVVHENQGEKIQTLQQDIDKYKSMIIDLQQQLLDSRKTMIEQSEKVHSLELKGKETERLESENTALKDQVKNLQRELDQEKSRSIWDRIFNK